MHATVPVVPDFEPGQIVTVFRSRLTQEHEPRYREEAAAMARLAAGMPGLVEFKSFTADDGERVTLVTFRDEDSQAAWRNHPEHRRAQRRGRSDYYAEFSLQVCRTLRVARHPSAAGPTPAG